MIHAKLFTVIGAILGFTAVALGAFGAHGLKARFAAQPELGAVYQTAAHYHLVHALALLATAWVTTRWPGPIANTAGWCFVGGVLLFSGSLYALALTGWRGLGAVTPFGGLALLAGWALLAWAALR